MNISDIRTRIKELLQRYEPLAGTPVFLERNGDESDEVEKAFDAKGLVLVVMTLSMNALAIWLRYRMRKKIKW